LFRSRWVAKFNASYQLKQNSDRFSGPDVSNAQVDDAVAVLFRQRGKFTLLDRILVDFGCIVPWLQLRANFEPRASDPECPQGRVARQ
jgi:hypothetical protein